MAFLSRNGFELGSMDWLVVKSMSCTCVHLKIDRAIHVKGRITDNKFISCIGFGFIVEVIHNFPVTITYHWSFIDTHCYLSPRCHVTIFSHFYDFVS